MASMVTRPCLSSLSLHRFTSRRLLPPDSIRGSHRPATHTRRPATHHEEGPHSQLDQLASQGGAANRCFPSSAPNPGAGQYLAHLEELWRPRASLPERAGPTRSPSTPRDGRRWWRPELAGGAPEGRTSGARGGRWGRGTLAARTLGGAVGGPLRRPPGAGAEREGRVRARVEWVRARREGGRSGSRSVWRARIRDGVRVSARVAEGGGEGQGGGCDSPCRSRLRRWGASFLRVTRRWSSGTTDAGSERKE